MNSHLLQKTVWELACGLKAAHAGAAWLALNKLASLPLNGQQNAVPGAIQRHGYAGTSGSGPCELSSTAGRLQSSNPLVSHLASASNSGPTAHLHSAAADPEAASDDDTRQLVYNSSQLFHDAAHTQHHQHHHAGRATHINSSHTAAKHHNHHHSSLNHTNHNRHHQAVQGHLHAAHPRRHAASSSSSQADALSDLVLSCKAMGGLRRIMLKYKANMGPEQVANTLLALQHLVREARQRRNGNRAQLQHPAEAEYQQEQRWWASPGSAARVQPRVRAAQEFNRATARAAESDGPQDQLIAQMLGELGNMIWHMMGDMSGGDLAKLLYSWAMLSWHPEQQLLADVAASFLAAAGAGPESSRSADSNQQQQQQEAAPNQLDSAAGPWLAAGLWGLARLGEPLSGPTLQLLLQHYPDLLHLWSPQQLADIAWALAAAADEQVAAEVAEGGTGDGVVEAQQEQLLPVVLELAGQLVELLQQQQYEASSVPQGYAVSSGMDDVWPEVLLQSAVAQRAAHPAELVAGSGPAAPAAVHNGHQLAWRMLQALAAVGVNVSEPDGHAGGLVAALSAAMQPPQQQW